MQSYESSGESERYYPCLVLVFYYFRVILERIIHKPATLKFFCLSFSPFQESSALLFLPLLKREDFRERFTPSDFLSYALLRLEDL